MDVYVPKRGHGFFPAVLMVVGSAYGIDDTKDPVSSVFAGIKSPRTAVATLSQIRKQAYLLKDLSWETRLSPYAFSAPITLANRWADEGLVVAGVNVRSSARLPFPGAVHDIKAAIRFLRAHAAEYRIDPKNIAVMGESSGGYMASMAAATSSGDPYYEGDVGVTTQSSAIQAAVPLFATSNLMMQAEQRTTDGVRRPRGGRDLHWHKGVESRFLGGPILKLPDETIRRADPATSLSPASAPMLLLHGTNDPWVTWKQSKYLFDQIAATGGTAELYLVEGQSHDSRCLWGIPTGPAIYESTSKGAQSTPINRPAPTYADVLEFLQKHLNNS